MLIRFHLDENIHRAIADGLRRRGIDVTTTSEANLISASDEEQLVFACKEGRVLVTHDDDLLRLHQQRKTHAGIAYVRQHHRSIGQVVLALAWLYRRRSAEQVKGQVEYL